MKEFYRRANIEDNLHAYTREYQGESDRLREPTAEMIRDVLSYLHTRPIAYSLERVQVKPLTTPKKNAAKSYTTREHPREFLASLPTCLVLPAQSTSVLLAMNTMRCSRGNEIPDLLSCDAVICNISSTRWR